LRKLVSQAMRVARQCQSGHMVGPHPWSALTASS
jgi:hypothetical protein